MGKALSPVPQPCVPGTASLWHPLARWLCVCQDLPQPLQEAAPRLTHCCVCKQLWLYQGCQLPVGRDQAASVQSCSLHKMRTKSEGKLCYTHTLLHALSLLTPSPLSPFLSPLSCPLCISKCVVEEPSLPFNTLANAAPRGCVFSEAVSPQAL